MRTLWCKSKYSCYNIRDQRDNIIYCCQCGSAILIILFLLLNAVTLLQHVNNDCDSDLFVNKLCLMRKDKLIDGLPCLHICEQGVASICPRYNTHYMNNSILVYIDKNVYSMNRDFYNTVMKYRTGAILHKNTENIHSLSELHQLALKHVNYLNTGAHIEVLSTIPEPIGYPLAKSYINNFISTLRDERFIKHLIFFGSGESSEGAPSITSDIIPAVNTRSICGGLYETYNLINYTVSLSQIIESTNSSWFYKYYLHPLYAYQVISGMLEVHELTSESQYEGRFYWCNVNSSQILLHFRCIGRDPSFKDIMNHDCTIRVLDLSEMITSEFNFHHSLSSTSCHQNRECRLSRCMGVCENSKCGVEPYTALITSLQSVCQIIKQMESRLLEPVGLLKYKVIPDQGQLYRAVDRCMTLYEDTHNMTESQRGVRYNVIYHELRDIILHQQYAIKTAIQQTRGV